MAVTNYHSVNGEIIGETTTGSPRVDYLTDALGSVTATVNQSGSVVNTYRYTPFGSTLAKTGTGADPAFGWVGEQGYRPTGNKFSDFYVRARHDDSATGRWTTSDPYIFFPQRGSYTYADNVTIQLFDRTGLVCSQPAERPCCTEKLKATVGFFSCPGGIDGWKKIPKYESGGGQPPGCDVAGNCAEIIKSIAYVAGACNRMCGASVVEGNVSYKKGAEVQGTQICCMDGLETVDCGVYWCVGNMGPSPDPCAIGCLYLHEREHSIQSIFGCVGNVSPGPKIKNRPAWAECDAYYLQMQCLLKAAKTKCICDTELHLLSDQKLQDLVTDCTSSANKRGRREESASQASVRCVQRFHGADRSATR